VRVYCAKKSVIPSFHPSGQEVAKGARYLDLLPVRVKKGEKEKRAVLDSKFPERRRGEWASGGFLRIGTRKKGKGALLPFGGGEEKKEGMSPISQIFSEKEGRERDAGCWKIKGEFVLPQG